MEKEMKFLMFDNKVNTELLKKVWNDDYAVSQFENEYVIVDGVRKVEISTEQAFDIIRELKLLQVKTAMFNCASMYMTESRVSAALVRLQKTEFDGEKEREEIKRVIEAYNEALSTKK